MSGTGATRATEATQAPRARAIPRGDALARALVVLLLAVLVAAAIALTVADRRQAEQARLAGEAVAVAEAAMTAMLDYGPDTVAEDLAAAEPLLTQPFLDTFREQSREVTIPRATAGQVTSSARSAGSALATLDGDEALVVVFLDRHTVGSDAIPRVLQTVVQVGLRLEGDRWLVSELSPR